jgi:NTE family protein
MRRMKIKHQLPLLCKTVLLSCFFLLLSSCAAGVSHVLTVPLQQPAMPYAPPPNITLVAGSEGANAYSLIGVLKVLKQNHIPINMIVATDSSSVVCSIYAADPNVNALQQSLKNVTLNQLGDFSNWQALTGPSDGTDLQNFILKKVRARDFNQLRIPLVTVATNLKTGVPARIDGGPLAPAINAACAMPPYFRAVAMYGHIFVSGNVSDPIPVDIAKQYKPKVIIAVDTAPILTRDIPTNAIDIFDRTYSLSDIKFNAYSAEGADVIIKTKIKAITVFDAHEKDTLIRDGENATWIALPKICAVLQKNKIASGCSHAPAPTVTKPAKKQEILKFFKQHI